MSYLNHPSIQGKRGSARSLSQSSQRMIANCYRARMQLKSIASMFGISRSSVYNYLRYGKTAMRSHSEASRKYSLNEHCFDDIANNKEAQYWCGFLMTDGCVYRDKCVELSLNSKDREIIIRFARFLGTNAPLSKKAARWNKMPSGKWSFSGQATKISIHSTRIAAILSRHGITPRKTFTATASTTLQCRPDFWRGCIDGDGSVLMVRRKKIKNGPIPVVSFVGTKQLVNQFIVFVKSICPACRATATKRHSIFHAKIKGRSAKKLAEVLYRGATVALKRKSIKAHALMQWEPTRLIWDHVTLAYLNRIRRQCASWSQVAGKIGIPLHTVKNILLKRRRNQTLTSSSNVSRP